MYSATTTPNPEQVLQSSSLCGHSKPQDGSNTEGGCCLAFFSMHETAAAYSRTMQCSDCTFEITWWYPGPIAQQDSKRSTASSSIWQPSLVTIQPGIYDSSKGSTSPLSGVFVTREHVRHNKSGITHRGKTRISH
jgi:hypothetical protein